METLINEYEQQGIDFLAKTNTDFKAEFVKHDLHFDGDTDKRDIYKITLRRGSRKVVFNFGQSINNSGRFVLGYKNRFKFNVMPTWATVPSGYQLREVIKNPDFAEPTPYSVLACLTKYDVGSLEDFCGEFGYDVDSKKAEKIYKAVCEEWANVQIMWTDAEIEQLQEIQ